MRAKRPENGPGSTVFAVPSPLELAWSTVARVRAAGGALFHRRGNGPGEPAWVGGVRGLDAGAHAALLAELRARKDAVVELLRWEADWERSAWDEARVGDHVAWAVRRFAQLGAAHGGPCGPDREAEAAAVDAIERARAARSPGAVWRACFDLLALAASPGAQEEAGE